MYVKTSGQLCNPLECRNKGTKLAFTPLGILFLHAGPLFKQQEEEEKKHVKIRQTWEMWLKEISRYV